MYRIEVAPGANNIQIIYETSPTKDESLFSAMATVSLEVNQVQVSPIILATAPAIPLARWVRWRLHVDGVADSNWLTTFRLHCAANAVGVI